MKRQRHKDGIKQKVQQIREDIEKMEKNHLTKNQDVKGEKGNEKEK